LFQEYSVDTATFTPLSYSGILSPGNGSVFNTGPTYNDPSYFFPDIELDSSRNILLLHPGSFASVRIGSVLGVPITDSADYDIAGAFARANDFENAGDGVVVDVFVNSDIGDPMFESVISSNNVVDPDSPFTGTGVAPFEATVALSAGDVVHFAVFSGANLTDGTFDVTALEATITSVPEPSVVSLFCAALASAFIVSIRARLIHLVMSFLGACRQHLMARLRPGSYRRAYFSA
jgi:hypothetical protein